MPASTFPFGYPKHQVVRWYDGKEYSLEEAAKLLEQKQKQDAALYGLLADVDKLGRQVNAGLQQFEKEDLAEGLDDVDLDADDAKFDESKVRRGGNKDNPGQFSKQGGGAAKQQQPNAKLKAATTTTRVGAASGVSADTRQRLEQAFKSIPRKHQNLLKNVPIRVFKYDKDAYLYDIQVEGQYMPRGKSGRIKLAENIIVNMRGVTSALPIKNPERVAVHELGHALDHKHDWGLSWNMEFDRHFSRGVRNMTRREKKNAWYFIGDDVRENFAETYALAYTPNSDKDVRFFGGMSRARANKLFGSAVKWIKENT